MKQFLQPFKRLIPQIFLLLCLYFLSRIVFTWINIQSFDELSFKEFLRLSFYGLRFDISAILLINGLYILLLFLPFQIFRNQRGEKFLHWLFVITNAIAFSFEISDWAYFPYVFKRSTFDVLYMITRKGDFLSLLPHFIVDFWYAPLGLILFVVGLHKVNKWICKKTIVESGSSYAVKIWLLHGLSLVLVLGLTVIGIRGGLQYIPIGNSNALLMTENTYVPVVLNTPFSIMHSYSGKLEEVSYFQEAELANYFDPIKNYSGKEFRNKNVVVIILESFSRKFTVLGEGISYTPFLDSLMNHSFVCRNGYANAMHSADGVTAIISGIPSLMGEPITTSSYGTNKLTSLPALLRDKGYETAFYHGGTNGTMSFNIYAPNAGYNKYYGRSEYNSEIDYDGNWGIWDEPFLQYFAGGLNKMKQPFMASVFTLNSHDPYKVPAQYKDVLPTGPLPIHQSVAYTDLAIKKFFDRVSKEDWFNNTLFVFSADHCSPITPKEYNASTGMDMYAIPIFFFAPGDSTLKGGTNQVVQQIDILPTVLDHLGYNESFFSFGNSAFREVYPRFVVNELSGFYRCFMDDYLLTANEMQPKALYEVGKDTARRKNLLHVHREKAEKEIIPYFKAFVQLYRSALIHNRLFVEKTISMN